MTRSSDLSAVVPSAKVIETPLNSMPVASVASWVCMGIVLRTAGILREAAFI
jgi:hypothetical protein